MIRKFIAALAVSAAALIVTAVPAVASTTEARPVTQQQTVVVSGTSQVLETTKSHPRPAAESPVIAVLPTSSSVESTAAGSLSYTGISFNVPLTLTIAALVVLGGFALVFFGGRGLSRTRRQH